MLSLLFLLSAVSCLSLAMNKHYKATFDKPLTEKTSKKLTLLGWLSLFLSLVSVEPTPINYVTWLTELSLVIMLQAWFLTKLQRHRKK